MPAEFAGTQVLEVNARGLTERDMPRVEPGVHDLEIVLPPRAFQSFRVLDDASGKPIERVELSTEEAGGSKDWAADPQETTPEYRDAPAGELTLPVGLRRIQYFARAPGHALRMGEVRDDLPPGFAQEVRMRTGARLLLRAVGEGGALAGAKVQLDCSEWAKPVLPGELSPAWEVAQGRHVQADEQGRIEIGELYGGQYTLRVSAHGLAPLERHELRIEPGQTLDLGAIELVPGASLCGNVKVPSGEDPARIVLVREGRGEAERIPLARDGSFRLSGLAAGQVELVVPEQEGVALMSLRFSFDLEANEMRWVSLDLAKTWPRPVHVHVLDHGQLVEGFRVCSRGREPRLSRFIATTDSRGDVSALVEPGIGAQIVLVNPFGVELEDRELDPLLAPGAAVEIVFELKTGTARLEFGEGFAAPKDARVRIDFTRRDLPEARPFWIFLRTGEDVLLEKRRLLEGRTIDLGRLSPGEYGVQLRFERWVVEPARPGAYRALPERFHAHLRVNSGEATVARLEREP